MNTRTLDLVQEFELTDAEFKRLREMSPLYEMHKEGIDLKSIQWAAH